jgi:hypothetical protein
MVGPRISPKFGDGDETPAANAPCWQTPRRDQLVQWPLANGEHMCGLLSARQDFAFPKLPPNDFGFSGFERPIQPKDFILLVPGGGVEPPRGCPRRILSPLRLPVPPSRLGDCS